MFLRIFAIICFLGASFVKIFQAATVLCAIEIFNVLAIHPDDHVGIQKPHDPCNPKGIVIAAQGIGCETMPGLFHFPVVQTSFFQGGYPYAPPQIAVIDHGFGW